MAADTNKKRKLEATMAAIDAANNAAKKLKSTSRSGKKGGKKPAPAMGNSNCKAPPAAVAGGVQRGEMQPVQPVPAQLLSPGGEERAKDMIVAGRKAEKQGNVEGCVRGGVVFWVGGMRVLPLMVRADSCMCVWPPRSMTGRSGSTRGRSRCCPTTRSWDRYVLEDIKKRSRRRCYSCVNRAQGTTTTFRAHTPMPTSRRTQFKRAQKIQALQARLQQAHGRRRTRSSSSFSFEEQEVDMDWAAAADPEGDEEGGAAAQAAVAVAAAVVRYRPSAEPPAAPMEEDKEGEEATAAAAPVESLHTLHQVRIGNGQC